MFHTKYAPIIIFIFVLALLVPSPFAKADGKSLVGVENVYENQKGKTVTFNLYIHGNENIAGGSLDLLYDQTALSVQTAKIGDQLSGSIWSVNTAQAGKVSLEWANAAGQLQEGTVLTITARLLKADETIPLDLQNVSLFREDYSIITVDSFNGEVKPFKGKQIKLSSKVKANKQWTIRFNKAFDSATVNKNTVMVLDSLGNRVDVNVQAVTGNSVTVTPKSDYKSGTYTLLVTEQVRTLTGDKLKQPVKYGFSVE